MKKFNWGHGIALTLASFAGFMGYLAYSSMSSPSTLVRENYYQSELEYTKKMEAEMRGNAIERPEVRLNDLELHLDYTNDHSELMENPSLYIYSPAHSEYDVTIPLEWKKGELKTQLTSLPKGLAYVMISWEEDGDAAFQRIVHHFPM